MKTDKCKSRPKAYALKAYITHERNSLANVFDLFGLDYCNALFHRNVPEMYHAGIICHSEMSWGYHPIRIRKYLL